MTTGIKNWSTTAADNDAAPPNGFPEGMAPAAVNDSARQVMAEVRAWYEDPAWIDFGDVPTQTGANTFTLSNDVTARYVVGRRIRMKGTTPFTLYGVISNSSYSAPNTTVTVTMDSGSLDSSLNEVALNLASLGDSGIPLLAANNAFTGNNTFSGKVLTPDDGELTIASGSITPTGVFHTVDTEGDAASDDLDTIASASDGQKLLLRTENNARDVVVKNNTGNILTPDGNDITLGATTELITLIYDGTLTKWLVTAQGKSLTAATQSDQETGTSTTLYVTPGRQQYHPSAAKAWVRLYYNSGVPTIRASYNVSGLVDNNTGDFTVNFTVPFSDANSYVALASIGSAAGNAAEIYPNTYNNGGTITADTPNAAYCRFAVINFAGNFVDPSTEIFIAFFGDQ